MKRKVIVSTLISCGDEYLFIKQNKPGGAYPGTLHIPGGGLEDGETPLDGVIREIREETGLVGLQNITPFDFDDDTMNYKGEDTQFIFLRYLAESKNKNAVAGSDAKEIVWVKKADVLKHPHNPATLRMLRKIKS